MPMSSGGVRGESVYQMVRRPEQFARLVGEVELFQCRVEWVINEDLPTLP